MTNSVIVVMFLLFDHDSICQGYACIIVFMDKIKFMKEQFYYERFSSITNIKTITNFLYHKIINLGFDVFYFTSNTSKSRYLEIFIDENEKVYVRISDHPSDCFTAYRNNYDIYSKKPRKGAINFIEFLNNFTEEYVLTP